MKKRVLMIAALVSGTLAISGCTTNPYLTGEREAGKSGIGAGIGSLVGAGVGALSSSKHDRGKGALIGAAAWRGARRRHWLLHGRAGSEAARQNAGNRGQRDAKWRQYRAEHAE